MKHSGNHSVSSGFRTDAHDAGFLKPRVNSGCIGLTAIPLKVNVDGHDAYD